MKLNKIIVLSFSLVLAPALHAQTLTAVDTARGLARGVVFHGSRFVAGILIDRAYCRRIHRLNGNKSPDSGLVIMAELGGLLAVGALTPKLLNKATASYMPSQLVWLAPTETKNSTVKQGSVAFWAGMISTRYSPIDKVVSRF